MLNAILSIAGSSHQGHECFSEISRGRQCSFMSFSALLCAQSFPVRHWDTATVDQRQDVLEWTWKSKYSRYRHVVSDLPAKSSSLDSSIARHWGHSTKSIARWGNKIAFWGKQFFILLQLCFKNVSSVYESSQHHPLKENIDLTVITFSTCILKWKGVFYFQMYLVFSYLKENTHLSMITFLFTLSRKTLCLFGEHRYHVLFLLHCYYMTRRICGIKQAIIVAFFCWLPIMFTLFPSLTIFIFHIEALLSLNVQQNVQQ